MTNLAARKTRLLAPCASAVRSRESVRFTVGPNLRSSASRQRKARAFPLGRTRIPFARFALQKIPAIDWTPPQEKRLGFGSVVTKVPPGARSGPQLTKKLLPTASEISDLSRPRIGFARKAAKTNNRYNTKTIDARHAPPFAREPSLERDRRAASRGCRHTEAISTPSSKPPAAAPSPHLKPSTSPSQERLSLL